MTTEMKQGIEHQINGETEVKTIVAMNNLISARESGMPDTHAIRMQELLALAQTREGLRTIIDAQANSTRLGKSTNK